MFRVVMLGALLALAAVATVPRQRVEAVITDCDAPVSPNWVAPGSTTAFTIYLTNGSLDRIRWLRFTRPSTNFTLGSISYLSGWSLVQSDGNSITVSGGSINTGATRTIQLTGVVAANVNAPDAGWIIEASDDATAGASPYRCTGTPQGTVIGTPAIVSGTITTFAGDGSLSYDVGDGGLATSASLNQPAGVALDGAGNLYIADPGYCRIREVSGGIITTVAGNGSCTYGGDGGPATSASLNQPVGVTLDGGGNLYIADQGNCRVRKVSGGMITTVAGNGSCAHGGDGGLATNASLYPASVALDGAGNLYIADGPSCRIREVSGGIITTIAGTGMCTYGGDGGPATSANLTYPAGVALDGAGNLYIADRNDCRVREVSGGLITTVAGDGSCGYGSDAEPAMSTSLDYPVGVALDADRNLYIADSGSSRIRKVSAGMITTVAGNGSIGYSGDGGPATSAGLYLPQGVALDGAGNLYIADLGSHRVRKVTFDPTVISVGGFAVEPDLMALGSPSAGTSRTDSLPYALGGGVVTATAVTAAGACFIRRRRSRAIRM